jgi:ribonuclease H2 subunit B
MTPIDPAFLVLPLLQAIHPVRYFIPLCCYCCLELMMQKEGSSFRPVEDMIEDAAKKLARDSVADAAKNPSLEVTEEDVMQLLQLSCVVDGVKRVCETKGNPCC